MSRASLLGQGALAAVLVGLLAVEYTAQLPEDAPLSLAAPRPPPAAVAAMPGPDAATARVADILARPLFSVSRRPAPGAAASGAPAAALPRLTAVLVSARGRAVIFAGGPEGKPVTLGEGGRIGAYVVQSIGAGEATLAGPDGSHVLRPAFAAPGAPAVFGAAAQPSIADLMRQPTPGAVLFPGLVPPATR